MKKLIKTAVITYLAIFLSIYVVSQIYILLGPTKEMLEKQDGNGNWYIEWSNEGPDVIPKNLFEAFEVIMDEIPEEKLKQYREYLVQMPDGLSNIERMMYDEKNHELDIGFGMSMRHAWGLWHGSRLARWMYWHGGSGHPDGMTVSIRNSFDAYIEHGEKPYRLKERLFMLLVFTTLCFIPLSILFLIYRAIKAWSSKSLQATEPGPAA